MQKVKGTTDEIFLNLIDKNNIGKSDHDMARQQLKNILLNKAKLPDDPITEQIFDTDLVMKIELPKKAYEKENSRVDLGEFVNKPPDIFTEAYREAFKALSMDMEKKGDAINRKSKKPQLRHFASLVPLKSDMSAKSCKEIKNLYGINNAQTEGKTKKRILKGDMHDEECFLLCSEEYYPQLDAFTIQYNALIYSLQNICGFSTKSFIFSNESKEVKHNKNKNWLMLLFNRSIDRTIYILLRLPDEKVLQVANRFEIQKEVDYTQIDPFLNQPKDSVNRPIKFHSSIVQIEELSVIYEIIIIIFETVNSSYGEEADSEHSLKFNEEYREKKTLDFNGKGSKYEFIDFLKRKTCERKLGLLLKDYNKNITIEDEKPLKPEQILRYEEFNYEVKRELEKLLYHKDPRNDKVISNFNQIEGDDVIMERRFKDPDDLTQEQREYLYNINRKKWNPGVKKSLIQVKKHRKYYEIIKEKALKYGYRVYPQPTLYIPFYTLSKTAKFFDRLEHMLLYKERVISPFGDMALFSKMQRIKLSYLVLKHFMRIQNFSKLNLTMFALENDFEKHGDIGKKSSQSYHAYYDDGLRKIKPEIEGGIDGKNLVSSWRSLMIWKNDYEAIREYLGEEKTFEVFIKTYIISLFVLLAPFSIVGEIIKRRFIRGIDVANLLPELFFNFGYLLIAVIIYGVVIEIYKDAEKDFLQNYIDKTIATEYRNDYEGPYTRDIVNDNTNIYVEENYSLKDLVIRLAGIIVSLCLLIGIIGFYYGIRNAIVDLSETIKVDSESFYLFRGVHLIVYSIFFTVNMILYRVILHPISTFITKYENWPTHKAYLTSVDVKLYILAIGVELIGPIDLLFVQYSAKTECLSSWCYEQLQAYIYSRYFIMVGYVLIQGGIMLFKYIKSRSFRISNLGKMFGEEEKEITFEMRLSLYLLFISKQSEKDKVEPIILIDETIALVHFCTFATVFPLAAAISLFSIIIAYNVERKELISNSQRPIPRSQPPGSYVKKFTVLGHWLILYNISNMILVLDWLEYIFQDLVLAILTQNISPSSMTALKYFTIIVLFLIFEGIMQMVRNITKSNISQMNKRKRVIYEKFHHADKFNVVGKIETTISKPMITISRVDFDPKYLKREEEEENEPVYIEDQQPLEMMMDINKEGMKNLKRKKSNKAESKLRKMSTIKEVKQEDEQMVK